MQIVVDGIATNYVTAGSGKVVVLLHGWGDKAETFTALQSELARKFQVIALDLPGFGNTEAPKDPWGLSDYALFVSKFLEKLAVIPYALIGHSNGGAIVIRGAGTGLLKTDKVVLLAASGIRDTYQARKKAVRLVAKVGKVGTKLLPKAYQNKLRRKVYDKLGSDMLVAEHLQETFKKVITDDVQKDAERIMQQTLLIYGLDDEATPPIYGQQFERLIPNAKLIQLPGSGHFLLKDKPHEVIKAIGDFL